MTFFEKIFNHTKKQFYKRKGFCKKCGNCCRQITFKIKDEFITTQEEFDRLKSWQKRYNHFFISGKDKDGTLLFTCKSLDNNNLCKNYFFRSFYCRKFPVLKQDKSYYNLEMIENCGYCIESSVKFSDFLNPIHER